MSVFSRSEPVIVAVVVVLFAWGSAAASARPEDPWLAARVEAQPIERVEAGEAELSLVVLERPAVDLPVSIRLGSETVELTENRLGWAEVVDAKARQPRFRTRFHLPTTAGQHTIHGEVAYVVCGERWCREKRGPVVWTFEISAPPTDR